MTCIYLIKVIPVSGYTQCYVTNICTKVTQSENTSLKLIAGIFSANTRQQ